MNNFYKGKKVLVTGNTGFKGTWLSQVLRYLGADVSGAALPPETKPAMYEILRSTDWIKEYIVDVRNYEELLHVFDEVQPQIVFHLAAQPIVIDSYRDPRYTYDVNVMGTVNVCECIRNTKSVKSFVNITTDKVYKNNEWEYPYRENDRLDGYDPYSNSKSCSELVTASYKRSFFGDLRIAVSTCRAGNVIGGGDFSNHRIIPDCFRSVVSGRAIEIRNPYSVRPYQHVLEAIIFYLLVAQEQMNGRDTAGEYNVGPEYTDCITTEDVAELFCRFWGGNASWTRIPYDGPHEANLLRLDTSRAKDIFHWHPVWNVEKAIEETVKWYQSYSKGQDMIRITEDQIARYLQDALEWWER